MARSHSVEIAIALVEDGGAHRLAKLMELDADPEQLMRTLVQLFPRATLGELLLGLQLAIDVVKLDKAAEGIA